MALVINEADYDPNREVPVGSVKPGNTVLISNPQGGQVYAYQICFIGNTQLIINDQSRPIVLMNHFTGRLVIKPYSLPCVVVSAKVDVYNLEKNNGE